MEDSYPRSKLMTAKEAVSRFAKDGDIIYIGYNVVPAALGHEVIRQKRKNLDIVGASQGFLAALMFYTGCANRTRTGYIGGMLAWGTGGHGIARKLADDGVLKYEEYTNQTCTLMFMAAALGIPFIPTHSLLGTDFLKEEIVNHRYGFLGDAKFKVIDDPWSGKPIVLLPALKPGLALWHCQRADEEGNVQYWGLMGDAKWACLAAERVIISVEEIVPTEVIRSDPNRTVIPACRVSAVVHEPFGAHPHGLIGYWDPDSSELRGSTNYQAYLDEWVYGVKDRKEYQNHFVERYGYDRLRALMPSRRRQPVGTVDYGYHI